MSHRPIRFLHRGAVVEVDGVATTRTLLDWLREDARCTGTKEGCNEGDCGACTVAVVERVDGHADDGARIDAGLRLTTANACIQYLPALDGKALFTVEDLRAGDELHPAQRAMVECHGSQCGFCTPGFVVSLWALFQHHRAAGTRPSRQQIADELSGNLCRCTGYRPIVDAGERMFELAGGELDASALAAALQRLAAGASVTAPDANAAPDASDAAAGGDATFRYRDAQGAIFVAPRRLDAFAAERLARPEARLLAGCTDIGLWTNKQFRELPDLLSIGNVAELRRVETRDDGVLSIGAAASLESAWRAVVARWPSLAPIWLRFAGTPLRHAGTMGGNVANGSPIGDSAPVLLALGATLVLRRGPQRRRLPLDAFYLGYMRNALEPGEFLESIEVDTAQRAELRAWKISKRFDCDISAVCAAFAVERDAEDRVVQVRLAFGGMAATVRRATLAEAALIGRPWDEAALEAARLELARDFTPLDDLRASAGYRLRVAGNLLRRLWLETRRDSPLRDDETNVWQMAHVLPGPVRRAAADAPVRMAGPGDADRGAGAAARDRGLGAGPR